VSGHQWRCPRSRTRSSLGQSVAFSLAVVNDQQNLSIDPPIQLYEELSPARFWKYPSSVSKESSHIPNTCRWISCWGFSAGGVYRICRVLFPNPYRSSRSPLPLRVSPAVVRLRTCELSDKGTSPLLPRLTAGRALTTYRTSRHDSPIPFHIVHAASSS
jgi:hypothetical protein